MENRSNIDEVRDHLALQVAVSSQFLDRGKYRLKIKNRLH